MMPSTTMLLMGNRILSARNLPFQPVLLSVLKEFVEIKSEALDLCRNPDREAFNRKPNPKGWSAAQCIEHLNLSGYEMALPTIEHLITGTRERGLPPRPDYRNGGLGEWFIKNCEPTSPRRFKTFKRFETSAYLEVEETVGRFLRLQDLLIQRLYEADELDIGSLRGRNAALIPLNIGQWFRFTAAHERRHLRQGGRAFDKK